MVTGQCHDACKLVGIPELNKLVLARRAEVMCLAHERHRRHLCIDMGTEMCTDMCTYMCIDMCIDICINMHIDMCMDMCTDSVYRHAYGHVY